MTSEQLAILNSLVTYAAENIPGGLSVDEREVAKIVGRWALNGKMDGQKIFRPVFAGHTDEGKKVILYIREGSRGEYHIQRPDGEFMPLTPGYDLTSWRDPFADSVSIILKSEEWCGTATGFKRDIVEAEMR